MLMEQSPLTQQPRPEAFQQKIVHLYEELFKDDQDRDDGDAAAAAVASGGEHSEGFWREFFLLRPDRASLRRILDAADPEDLLHGEARTRELFARSVGVLRPGPAGREGRARRADVHALDTLSTFLSAVLAKKYTNPSSDIIAVLAGLDHVDAVFTDFVGSLDAIIRNGSTMELRQKAVEVALAVTSGAYQTSLLTYFIQRDMFPSVMKYIQEVEDSSRIFEPFTLLGLLANYNKFEFQNPYQLRLNDFVNEETIQRIIRSVGSTCQKLRTQFVDVQEDIPEGWSLGSTLNMIGLGAIVPGPRPEKKPVYDADTAKKMFAELPGNEAAVLLATYDFTHANKLFCFNLVTLPAEKGQEQPFAAYLSLTSYLLTHAHLSQRTAHYTHLNLTVFRLLTEDPVLCKRLCSSSNTTTTTTTTTTGTTGDATPAPTAPVRLCRQRQPHLPLARGPRAPAAAVVDCMVDGLNRNLRRRLDVRLYTLCAGVLLRVVGHLARTRTRLPAGEVHWSELWRALLSLVRFLTTYAADLRGLPHVETLLDLVVNLVALGLSAGEAFLPGPAAYDDLFYKVVEAGDLLVRFRDTWALGRRPSNSIETLVSVSAHYTTLLAEGGGGDKGEKGEKRARIRGKQLTSLQVAEVIKQGYDSLTVQAKEGLDSWERFREADERTLLKKVARVAVADVRVMVAE